MSFIGRNKTTQSLSQSCCARLHAMHLLMRSDNVDSERIVQASHLRSDVGSGTALAICEEAVQVGARQKSRDNAAYPRLDAIRSVQF